VLPATAARPPTSTTRGSTPFSRGRAVLESVAFDPFSDSESFRLLLQSPLASAARRGDSRAVAEFRHWLSQRFPQLLRTFRALHMISVPDPAAVHHKLPVNQRSGGFDESAADGIEKEHEIDGDEAWRLLLRYATVTSALPGETIAMQAVTRPESVYFLLNGHCELSFRPLLLRPCSSPSTPSGLPRMKGGGDCPVMHLRELSAGDCFGLDAAAFGFDCLLSTVTAGSARQRNFLGLREATLTYLLCVPYPVVQQLQLLQRRQQDGSVRLPAAFPYSFAPDAEAFLRNTFLFRAMADSSRRFLAAHLSPVLVKQQEYLFTPGQPVRVFIVVTGQLTLAAPREKRAGGRQEADLELELLQSHDSVGLAEVLRLATSFERYCVVTSAKGARAYALPPTILLMVLAQESASLTLIHEWIAHRKVWVELRRATALAQRKKLAAEGSEPVVRLTLAVQRRSKLTCSRCGWAGHVSTSSSCVRVGESAASSTPQLDKQRRRPREGSRAARQQARKSQTHCRSAASEASIDHREELLPASSTGTEDRSRMPARRRLKIDASIVLRALQISRVSVGDRLEHDETPGRASDTRVEQCTTSTASSTKRRTDDALRSCTLAQSLERLDAALHHNQMPSAQQARR